MSRCAHRHEGVKPVGELVRTIKIDGVKFTVTPDYRENELNISFGSEYPTIRAKRIADVVSNYADFINRQKEKVKPLPDVFITKAEFMRRTGFSLNRTNSWIRYGHLKANVYGLVNYTAYIKTHGPKPAMP